MSSINSPISALKKVCLFVCLFNHRRWYRRIGRILKIGDARIVYYVRTKDIIFKCFGEIALQIRQCLCMSVKESRRKRGSYFEGPWAPGSCPLPTSASTSSGHTTSSWRYPKLAQLMILISSILFSAAPRLLGMVPRSSSSRTSLGLSFH